MLRMRLLIEFANRSFIIWSKLNVIEFVAHNTFDLWIKLMIEPKQMSHFVGDGVLNVLLKFRRTKLVARFFNFFFKNKDIRINDRKFAGLIRRFLKAEILKQDGSQTESTVGTPQGSIMSPILANIYLHHVIDKWFAQDHASKDAVQVRYADDAVFMFSQEDKAKAFLIELENRLTKFGLSLNKDKTGIINFKKGKEQTFNFLGFTFYWNHKKGWNKINLVVKTQKDKLFKKVSEYTEWLRENRANYSTKEIWKITASKLRGHYNYFGYFCNRNQLLLFYYEVTRSMLKWLNRRSQRKSFTWKAFQRKLYFNPLPLPNETAQLKNLGWSPYVK